MFYSKEIHLHLMISQLLFRSRVWSIVSKISIKSINQILFFLIWVHQVVYILACYNQGSKAKNINKQDVVNFKSQRSPIISNSINFYSLSQKQMTRGKQWGPYKTTQIAAAPSSTSALQLQRVNWKIEKIYYTCHGKVPKLVKGC